MGQNRQRDGLLVKIDNLIDDAKCFDTVRNIRWPKVIRCPECSSAEVVRYGRDQTQPARQRYHCKGCNGFWGELN